MCFFERYRVLDTSTPIGEIAIREIRKREIKITKVQIRIKVTELIIDERLERRKAGNV